MIKQWIGALESGKYQKHTGNFVPLGSDGENFTLAKENCACALGVYLIEVAGFTAQEIAHKGYDTMNYWEFLNSELGEDCVSEIYQVNDANGPFYRDFKSPNFDYVIQELKKHV